MALSLATVGAKITASFINAVIAIVNRQGTTAMIPTSATGAGVALGAGGVVTLTAASNVQVNGCFTAAFENYLVLIDLPTGGTGSLSLQLSAGGTPAAAANYDYQVFSSSGATVAGANGLAGTSWPVSAAPTLAYHDMALNLFRPQLAVGTTVHQTVLSTPNPGSASMVYSMRGFLHRLTVSYDGFMLAGSGISGTIRIYGLANN